MVSPWLNFSIKSSNKVSVLFFVFLKELVGGGGGKEGKKEKVGREERNSEKICTL